MDSRDKYFKPGLPMWQGRDRNGMTLGNCELTRKKWDDIKYAIDNYFNEKGYNTILFYFLPEEYVGIRGPTHRLHIKGTWQEEIRNKLTNLFDNLTGGNNVKQSSSR